VSEAALGVALLEWSVGCGRGDDGHAVFNHTAAKGARRSAQHLEANRTDRFYYDPHRELTRRGRVAMDDELTVAEEVTCTATQNRPR